MKKIKDWKKFEGFKPIVETIYMGHTSLNKKTHSFEWVSSFRV
jgi:hypothetical protein